MNKQLLVFPGYIETNCCTFYFLFLTSTFCFDSPWSFFVCLFWFNSRHWSFLFFKFSSTERFRVVGIKMLVAPSCSTLCNPVDSNLPGSLVHGIFQARILEWVAIPFSRGSSRPRDQTQVSHIAGRFFTIWATREALWGLMMATDHFILLWWICKSHVVSSWNWTGPWWFELFGMVKEIFIYSRPSL